VSGWLRRGHRATARRRRVNDCINAMAIG
jgi:hypothetical protein